MDLFDKCNRFKEHRLAKAAGIYPYFLPIAENHGTEVTIDGRRIIMAGSNNYLGLTTHPRLRQRAIDAIHQYGVGTGSVRPD